MMIEKRFYCGKPAAGTATTVISLTKDIIIKEFLFCNVNNETAAEITVSVEGDDAAFYSIINRKTVAANGTVVIPLSMPLPANRDLTVRAYTANDINVIISGVEM